MSNDAIQRETIASVRRFNRAVTRRVGAFADRFLGRDRPLAEARLLFEIGREGSDVRELRRRLDFDSGYLSRLLRSLEKQRLVEVARQQVDRRIRHASLTPSGERELAELDRRGDAFAESLLAQLTESEKDRVVTAMREVEQLLSLSATSIAIENPTSPEAQWCVQQYFAELDERFDGGFDAGQTISADPEETTPPHGAFLIARLDGSPIACGALKRVAPAIGTIKRMWVAKSARGMGLGRRMLRALEEQARDLGFATLRLETNRSLVEARRLYRRSGYQETAPFNDEPHAHYWFEKNTSPLRND